jgi:hypothetical protein
MTKLVFVLGTLCNLMIAAGDLVETSASFLDGEFVDTLADMRDRAFDLIDPEVVVAIQGMLANVLASL